MENEFVTYEQALALKELGFDEPCFGKYDIYGSFDHKLFYHNHDSETSLNCSAPTFSQAFRWFREKYKLHSYIHSDYSWNISGGIWDLNGHIGSRYDWDSDTYPTYEEAEQACLNNLIEIVLVDSK